MMTVSSSVRKQWNDAGHEDQRPDHVTVWLLANGKKTETSAELTVENAAIDGDNQTPDENTWVSDSPYLHAFDRLDEVHHQMEEIALTECLLSTGYAAAGSERVELPNGKAFVRLDYKKLR